MIKLPNRNRKGFTLVELMIVITVIAILATIAIVSFTRVQKQARDTKRKAEIRSMTTALQAYYTEKQTYPNVSPVTPGTPQVASVALTALTTPVNYMSTVPTAPLGSTGTNNLDYTYITDTDGFKYGLCVMLETPKDPLKPMWVVDTNNAAGSEKADAACVAN